MDARGYRRLAVRRVRECRKLKDQERQGQLIKERIEERKRRKQQKQETSLSDTPGRQNGVFVVQVSESNNTFSSVDETDDWRRNHAAAGGENVESQYMPKLLTMLANADESITAVDTAPGSL